jgi:hypothetical protein
MDIIDISIVFVVLCAIMVIAQKAHARASREWSKWSN